MLINIEENYFQFDEVASILAEQPPSSGTAGQFEFKACSRITLKKGQSFLVHMSPAEAGILIQDVVAQDRDYSNVKALPDFETHLHDFHEQIDSIAEAMKYMAEMCARLSMHITAGKQVGVKLDPPLMIDPQ